MKKVFATAALALIASAALVSKQASALPTPLWACSIKATSVHDNRFYVILKAGEVEATGTMKCVSMFGEQRAAAVNIDIKELGIGAGFGFPVEKASLDILQIKGGLASPEGMYGQYALQAGVGLTLVANRVAIEGGVEATPYNELGGKVQVKLEQLAGLGIDVTGSTMTISPARRHR